MAILQCYYCKKIDIEHNRDGKDKVTCVDCDKQDKSLNTGEKTALKRFNKAIKALDNPDL